MGKANKQRRADKKRKAEKTNRRRAHGSNHEQHPRDRSDIAEVAETLIFAAADDNEHFDTLCKHFAFASSTAVAIEDALERIFFRGLAAGWENGWQPTDMVHLLSRKLSKRARRFAIDMIANQATFYLDRPSIYVHPDWRRQLEDLGATLWWNASGTHLSQWAVREDLDHVDALRTATDVVARLVKMPRLPEVTPPPGKKPTNIDIRTLAPSGNKMLDRVRALLAKAESTEFDSEAESLFAKAQELMTRHTIDHAMLHSGQDPGTPQRMRIVHDDPHAQGKALLLTVVSEVNRCRSVFSPHVGLSTVFGFRDDLEVTELLYASLLVQASAAMVRHGSVNNKFGRSMTTAFRQSFLDGFANRIGERLESARDHATTDAETEHGSGVALVMSDRSKRIDDAVDDAYPELTHNQLRSFNAAGYAAGQSAATTAQLDVFESIEH